MLKTPWAFPGPGVHNPAVGIPGIQARFPPAKQEASPGGLGLRVEAQKLETQQPRSLRVMMCRGSQHYFSLIRVSNFLGFNMYDICIYIYIYIYIIYNIYCIYIYIYIYILYIYIYMTYRTSDASWGVALRLSAQSLGFRFQGLGFRVSGLRV